MSTSGGRLPLTPEQLVSWLRPGDARLSPDGELAAFTLKPVSKEGEHPESAIWTVPIGEGEPRRFSGGLWNNDAPRWSPDGRYLAVLFTEPETEEEKQRKEERDDARVWDADWKYRRLWVIDLQGGEAGVVSPERQQMWGYARASGSQRLAIDLTPTPLVDEWFQENEVAVVSLDDDDGERRTVLRLTGQAANLTWSPDGSFLAYIAPLAASLTVIMSIMRQLMAGSRSA